MNDLNKKISDITNTVDSTAEFDKQDIEDNRIMALLSYLFWLVLIPIFAAPKSKFARFHANQGLVLTIIGTVVGAVLSIVGGILGAILSILGTIVGIIGAVIGLAFLILAILGIVNAINGKAKELPLIGGIKILK